MAVDLCASSLSSSAAGALRLSWRLHGSYHQTRACVQNEEYINMDLPKARWKKLVITHCNFSSSIQSLLRFPTQLTENTSLSNCFSSCRHEIRNKKNCSACGRSLFWQKPLLMEGDVLLIISSLWNSQHHFPHFPIAPVRYTRTTRRMGIIQNSPPLSLGHVWQQTAFSELKYIAEYN